MEQIETTLIATRVTGKGDTWLSVFDDSLQQFPSLTHVLEAYFQSTGKTHSYKLSPMEGKLYVINIVDVPKPVEPPIKKFDIYGEQ